MTAVSSAISSATDDPAAGRPATTAEESARPAVTEDSVASFARNVAAALVLARLEPDEVTIWHDGTRLPIPETDRAWSDGRFIYHQAGGAGGLLPAKAFTADSSLICEVDGRLHHVTERNDGSYVAAVEGPFDEGDWTSEVAVPLFAEDCETGDRTPIEPINFYGAETDRRYIERVRDRVFSLRYDVEGNVDVLNEGGLVVNGEDRDTTTGAKLWTVELDVPFLTFDFVGDQVVVQLPESFQALIDGTRIPNMAVVLDALTGEQLDQVELGFETLFVG